MCLYNFSLPEGDFSLSPDSSPPLGKDAEGHTMTVAPRDTATYDHVWIQIFTLYHKEVAVETYWPSSRRLILKFHHLFHVGI